MLFQAPIGFIKSSISLEFVPLLLDKDLLHKIFASLRGIKHELYAKSFQVNDKRENLPPNVENARQKPLKRAAKDLSRDLQGLEVRGKLGSKALKNSLKVSLSKTVLNSGFYAVDSGFLFSGTWIPDYSLQRG